jgi:hypothetical protein
MTMRNWNRAVRALRLVAVAAAVIVLAAPGRLAPPRASAAAELRPGGPPSAQNAMVAISAGTKPANCGTPNTPPCVNR